MRSPHNATIFNYRGETDGSAVYEPCYLYGVRFDCKINAISNNNGVSEKSLSQLYVYFEDVKTVYTYSPLWEYVKMSEDEKKGYWTIDPEHDMFCYGIAENTNGYTVKITDIAHCYDSEGELHHLEIAGE